MIKNTKSPILESFNEKLDDISAIKRMLEERLMVYQPEIITAAEATRIFGIKPSTLRLRAKDYPEIRSSHGKYRLSQLKRLMGYNSTASSN